MKRSERTEPFRKWICWLAAAALLLTAVSVGGGFALAQGQSPAQAFTAYYTDSMKGAADGTAAFVKEELSARWTVNADGRARRNDQGCTWGEDVDKTMAVLYYNPRTYESFDMTVEYAATKGYSDWVAFFGFGATMGRSWMDGDSKGDTAFVIHPGGLLLNAKNKSWYAGNAVSDQVRNAGGTWNAEGVHTLRLRVNGVSFKVWIDGYELTGGSNPDYEGGYIYFAANALSVQFGVPEVQALAPAVEPDALTAYYTDSVTDSEELQAVELTDYWQLSDDGSRLVRTEKDAAQVGDGSTHMAALFSTAGIYRNFETRVQVTHPANDRSRALIGFGGTDGKNWRLTEGASAFTLDADGAVYDAVSGEPLSARSARQLAEAAVGSDVWDREAAHEVTVRMLEQGCTIDVDGYRVYTGTAETYTEGALFIGSGTAGVAFGALTTKKLKSFDHFTPYYAPTMLGDQKPRQTGFTAHWELNELGYPVSRYLTNQAYALLVDNTDVYRDFELTVQYSAPSDYASSGLVAFGFGGQPGGNLSDTGAVGYLLHAAGAVLNAKNESWVTAGDKTAAAQAKAAGKTYDAAGLHTLQVTVDSRKVKATIDGYTVAEFTLSESYEGGCVWFAARADGVMLKDLTVKKLNALDTSEWKPYHTNTVVGSQFFPEQDLSRYWEKTNFDTCLTRVTDKDGDTGSNVAIFYYTTGSYANVSMTARYATDGSDRYVTYFGIGAETGVTWMDTAGDTVFGVNGDGKVMNVKTGELYETASAKAQTEAAGKAWDAVGMHTLHIRMVGTAFTVTIDGYTVAAGQNDQYTGGRIYVGASAAGISFNKIEAVQLLDTSVFTPYYTGSMKGAAAGTAAYTQEEFSKHWAINAQGRAQRNFDGCTWGEDVDSTMAVLYYNVRAYQSFDMTVEYATTSGGNDWVAFFGFGGEIGKSWQAADNKSDTAFIIHAGGLFLNAKNKAWLNNGKAASDQTNAAQGAGTWKNSGVHTLHVNVSGQSYTLWIDGYLVCTGSNANYTGGYIYFAANAGTVQFGTPQIKELTDTAAYEAYYTDQLTTDDLQSVALEDKWSVTADGLMLSRKDGKDSKPSDSTYEDLSVLYYKKARYKNFDMTVEYTALSNMDDFSCLVGFGASAPGKSWLAEKQQKVFLIHSGGGILDPTTLNWYNGKPVMDQMNAALGTGTWKTGGTHTLRVRCEDNYFTIWIDGYLFTEAVNSQYKGGYIYFASNAAGVQFGLPTVLSLDEEEDYYDPDYKDDGWQPTAEDAYFDFSQRKKETDAGYVYTPIPVR